jgi:hypothetical protein
MASNKEQADEYITSVEILTDENKTPNERQSSAGKIGGFIKASLPLLSEIAGPFLKGYCGDI